MHTVNYKVAHFKYGAFLFEKRYIFFVLKKEEMEDKAFHGVIPLDYQNKRQQNLATIGVACAKLVF